MRLIYFIVAIGLLAGCLAAPFPRLDRALPFSRHMISHTAIQLLVAPLLVLAIPSKNPFTKALNHVSSLISRYPILAWLAGVGSMWLWHLPILCTAMPMAGMHHQDPGAILLNAVHTISLLIGGIVFSWPVITPYKECRLLPLTAVLYLATACAFCSLLGLLIAFAPPGTYPHVTSFDRQTGGLIMWVPCCFVYLAACMYLLINWFSVKDDIALAKTSIC